MVVTTAMITGIVGYLAKTLQENKSIKDFFNSFTDATVKTIRPIFIIDDDFEKPKEEIEDLKSNPEDKDFTDAVENKIKVALKKDPTLEDAIKAMYEELQTKVAKGEAISIANSKNIVVNSNLKAKGNIIIGDNNNVNN